MVDVETDGPIPSDFSMICFGAVVVDDALDKIFYERYCSEDNSLKFLPNQYHPVAEWIKIHNDQLTFVSNVNDFLNDSIRFHPIHLFYSLGLDANKGNLQVDMREYLSRVIFYTREKFKIYNDVSVEFGRFLVPNKLFVKIDSFPTLDLTETSLPIFSFLSISFSTTTV